MNPSYLTYPGLKQHLLTPKQLFRLRGKRKDLNALGLIFTEICDYFELLPNRVKLKSRKWELVWARFLYCYFSRKFTSIPLMKIAEHLDWNDHANVIYGDKKAKLLIGKHEELASDANILEGRITDKLYVENKTIKDLAQ